MDRDHYVIIGGGGNTILIIVMDALLIVTSYDIRILWSSQPNTVRACLITSQAIWFSDLSCPIHTLQLPLDAELSPCERMGQQKEHSTCDLMGICKFRSSESSKGIHITWINPGPRLEQRNQLELFSIILFAHSIKRTQAVSSVSMAECICADGNTIPLLGILKAGIFFNIGYHMRLSRIGSFQYIKSAGQAIFIDQSG